MLKQRILTALILAPLALLAIFFLPLNTFASVFLVIMAIGAWEWGPLMGFNSLAKRLAFVVATALFIAALWYFHPINALWSFPAGISQYMELVLWLAAAWWVVSAILTLLYPRFSSFWSRHRSVRGLFGWLTLVPTWVAFVVIRSSDYAVNEYFGAQLLMFLFLMVWSADIGAYFVGKSLGKHKLLPNVSPGKTLEGFLGGVVVACLLVAVAGLVIGFSAKELVSVIVVTAIISTVSVLGDLNESMFKRQAGVKDSGAILPGHGGILDRIDSLTATAPVYALCYLYIGL